MSSRADPAPAGPDAPSGAPDAPVVVAGAGPVGLVAALLLARAGVPATVLEAADRCEPAGSKAICFQRDVLDVLDRAGCAERMIARGVTWTTGRTYYRGTELFAVTFPDAGRGDVPPWINISQAEVERYLRDLADAEPLVDVRYGHRVTGLHQDEDGVRVRAETPGGAATVAGSHLIGADGPHSAVRRLLGVGFPGRSFDDRFLICDVRADLPFPNERRFYFDPEWNPGRQVLVHQCPDRTWRIDWQMPAGYDFEAERASGALDARIREITGDAPYEIVWASVYRFHQRCAETFRRGRAFLAGDAAHLYAPFGARGLNSGVQDAENLAWKLAFARRGHGSELLLASYDTERRAAARENLAVTTRTMEFLVPHTAGERDRRLTALDAALTDPGARARIDSGKLAEPYWYLDSPLTTPPRRPGSAPAGGFPRAAGAARPPVPGVLCPDGPCVVDGRATRLRRLFGAEFVALAAAGERCDRIRESAAGVPLAVHALDAIDASGAVRAALRAGPDTVHLVRPDGHLAAVLPAFDPGAFTAALLRACGRP